MDRPFADETHRRRTHRLFAEALGILEVRVRTVDRFDSRGARRHKNLTACVMPDVAGISSNAAADRAAHPHTLRRREITGTEDYRFEARTRTRDLLDVDQRGHVFNQHFERHMMFALELELDLGEQRIDPENVARSLDLRDDDRVEVIARFLDDLDHVLVRVLGLDIVHPDRAHFLAPVERAERLDHNPARGSLLVGRDCVLEVEEDHVGVGGERFLNHPLAAARGGKFASAESHCSMSLYQIPIDFQSAAIVNSFPRVRRRLFPLAACERLTTFIFGAFRHNRPHTLDRSRLRTYRLGVRFHHAGIRPRCTRRYTPRRRHRRGCFVRDFEFRRAERTLLYEHAPLAFENRFAALIDAPMFEMDHTHVLIAMQHLGAVVFAENLTERVERVVMQYRHTETYLVEPQYLERVFARILHRETDHDRRRDAAESYPMLLRRGLHHMLVEMALRRVHHEVRDEHVFERFDRLAARVFVDVADREILVVIIFAGERGRFENLGEPRVAPIALEWEILGVAVTAVNLERIAGHPLGHLGGEPLHHRGFLVTPAFAVDFGRDEVHELARRFDIRRHLGEFEPDRLELADRTLELDAPMRVGDRVVECAARKPDRARRGMHPRSFEPRHHRVKTAPLLPHHAGDGHAAVVEVQFPGPPAEIANLANRRAGASGRQLAALLFDHELTNADVAAILVGRRRPRE